jgi:hypothetical protein
VYQSAQKGLTKLGKIHLLVKRWNWEYPNPKFKTGDIQFKTTVFPATDETILRSWEKNICCG